MPKLSDISSPGQRSRRTVGTLAGAAMFLMGLSLPSHAEDLVSVDLADATPIMIDNYVSASAVLTQTIVGNDIEEVNVVRINTIVNSFNRNRGLLQANVDNGNVNNQANILVMAFGRSRGSVVVDLSMVVATKKAGNTNSVTGGFRENRVENSFNGNVGVAQMNVNSGNLNNQRNVVVIGNSVSIGTDFAAVTDAWLGTVVTANKEDAEPTASRRDIISNSFKDFKGVAAVTMTSGDNNSVSNLIGISLQTVNIP